MRKLFGLAYDPPPQIPTTPQSIHDYLMEQYRYDDVNMVYSNLWSQQINQGNSWENFYKYFERMGLIYQPHQPEISLQPAVTTQPEVTIQQDNTKLIEDITAIFRNMLNREPAKQELDTWVDTINKGYAKLSDVEYGISASEEYLKKQGKPVVIIQDNTKLISDIIAIFRNLLNREPYEKELNDWIMGINMGQATLQNITDSIIASDEYKTKHPVSKTNILPIAVAGAGVALVALLS